MFSDIETTTALASLGTRLKGARLTKGDSQALFAKRIGVSVPTLRDMEQGSATVAVGAWAAALWMLSRLADIDRVLEVKESLFDQIARQPKPRQRAPRKTKKP